MSLSQKLYRFLLRAYPRRYRDAYAQPMEQLFRDQLRDAHTIRQRSTLYGAACRGANQCEIRIALDRRTARSLGR